MPVVLAGADKLIVASPLLPAMGLIFTQPKPVVSILHSSLQVNDRDLVPPPSGMVSVIFEIVITAASLVFLQEKKTKTVTTVPNSKDRFLTVSYTHLTLPTIYSV